MKKHKLYFIRWADATSNVTWASKEELQNENNDHLYVDDVGWVISNTAKYLTICSQITSDGGYGNRTKIPKSLIVEQRRLVLTEENVERDVKS